MRRFCAVPYWTARVAGWLRPVLFAWCHADGYVPIRRDALQAAYSHIESALRYLGSSGHLGDGRPVTRRVQRRLTRQLQVTRALLRAYREV